MRGVLYSSLFCYIFFAFLRKNNIILKNEFYSIKNIKMKKEIFRKALWKKAFLVFIVICILYILYWFVNRFYQYKIAMERRDTSIIPNTSKENQFNKNSIYIDWDFTLDLYSYKEDVEKLPDTHHISIYSKQHIEKGNRTPDNKVVIFKRKWKHDFNLMGLSYFDNVLFNTKLVDSRNTQIIKGNPNSDILIEKNWEFWKLIPFKNYTLSGNTLSINLPSEKFLSEGKETCNSFPRLDCILFNNFFRETNDFYYLINIYNWDTIQPWDTLSLTTKK